MTVIKKVDYRDYLTPAKPRDWEEEQRKDDEYWRQVHSYLFYVKKKNISFSPDTKEVFFYTPYSCSALETLISENLEEIRGLFNEKGLTFIFLPVFNNILGSLQSRNRISYYNPRVAVKPISSSENIFSYDDLRALFCIPDRIDAPCLIRYKLEGVEHIFSFRKLESKDSESLLTEIREYLSMVGNSAMYHFEPVETIKKRLEGKPADDRFDEDVYLIGREIRERIDKLRAKGLTELAIRKLVGDSSNDPSPLRIDRYYRLFLTAYGNKEIVLSPIHKAVFFLFLNHPEGIFFKDLPSYRDELSSIYHKITSREDTRAVEESIDKLTDPYNNSINEKCARIKNAFVSEFREEIAQWYFIRGAKGQKKAILLPRNLVTWETAEQ